MKDKEKQIKEITNEIRPILENRTDIRYIPNLDKPIAKELISLGYQKVDKDSVVLNQEEWKNLHEDYAKALYEKEKQTRKETAREIIKWFKENALDIPSDEYINEFAKQYGVEIKK